MKRTFAGPLTVRTLILSLGVVGLGACGGGESAATNEQTSQSVPTEMLSEGGTQPVLPAAEHSIDELGFNQGSPDAPIKIVEFSDFGCGYCRRFHTEIFPALQEKWIDEGVVQWKYVTYVSGMFPNGLPAAFAAECVGEQDEFEPMSKMLYERQQDWKSHSDPQSVFEGYANEVGVDMSAYASCLSEDRRRSRVRSGILAGARLGVRGTPSFIVDGYPLVGAQPLEIWNDILTARVKELEEAGGP